MRTKKILKDPKNFENRKITPKENLVGKVFNYLTVLKQDEDYISPKGKRQTRWICQCSCENHTIASVLQCHLISNKVKSCGCLKKHRAKSIIRTENAKNNPKFRKNEDGILIEKRCSICKQWKKIEEFGKNKKSIDGYECRCKQCSIGNVLSRYYNTKNSAEERSIPFNLTLERFEKITSNPCFYCGEYYGYFCNKGYSGIDRVDSFKGYTVENSIPCCRYCNIGKGQLSFKNFIKHTQKISNYFDLKKFQNIISLKIIKYVPKKLSCANNVKINYHYNNKGEIIEKQCKLCLNLKTLDNFYKRSAQKDGFNTICKECRQNRVEERYLRYKNRTKNSKIDFKLTLDEFYTLTSMPCIYCGEYDKIFMGKKYTGIDRIDSSKGYILNNCVPCCFICNRMKLNGAYEEFINRAGRIYNNFKESVNL